MNRSDILIFLTHHTTNPYTEKYILDYGSTERIPHADPYLDFNTNYGSTGLCRNKSRDSLHNWIRNTINKGEKRNIYLIYIWKYNNKLTNKITCILKVNKEQCYKNHKEAYDNGHHHENNGTFNNFINRKYKNRTKNPYITGKIVEGSKGLKLKEGYREKYKIGYLNGGNTHEANKTGYIRSKNYKLSTFLKNYTEI